MKYMGSKRAMLQNGLSEVLATEARSAARIVDLFCGSGSVSWFAATTLKKPVLAYDLQQYAVTVAASVVKRLQPQHAPTVSDLWLSRAARTQSQLRGWSQAWELDHAPVCMATWRRSAQEMCSTDGDSESSLIWRCYGGHYFSPTQALSLDAMLLSLPDEIELRELCLAATIIAASRCVASPGHTAQPFKATRTAERYLRQAWRRDPFHYAREALKELCARYAFEIGDAVVADANHISKSLRSDDLVFVDPPYSAVQYSRFYHVLETIARGTCGDVEGEGRYPPPEERPNSCYSRKDSSRQAIQELLRILSANGCTVILTFPQTVCSNGLSGELIEDFARQLFHVTRRSVKTRFSTLGGNTRNRTSRRVSDELMLVLNGR